MALPFRNFNCEIILKAGFTYVSQLFLLIYFRKYLIVVDFI